MNAAARKDRNLPESVIVALLGRNQALDAGQQVFFRHAVEGDVVFRLVGIGSDGRCALIGDGFALRGFRLVHLLDDAYAAVLPLGHPLAGEEVIDLNELSGEQWVGSEPPGPCLEPVIDSCAAAGFSPDFVIQSEDYATAQGFVAAGLGVGLMPRLGLRNRHPGIVVRPVRNPEPVRVISVAVRQAALEQPALRSLLDALRDAAATDPPDGAGAD